MKDIKTAYRSRDTADTSSFATCSSTTMPSEDTPTNSLDPDANADKIDIGQPLERKSRKHIDIDLLDGYADKMDMERPLKRPRKSWMHIEKWKRVPTSTKSPDDVYEWMYL